MAAQREILSKAAAWFAPETTRSRQDGVDGDFIAIDDVENAWRQTRLEKEFRQAHRH